MSEPERQARIVQGPVTRASLADHALISWLARYHKKPISPAALTARLPAGSDPGDADQIARGLAAVGLTSRLVRRDPSKLEPAVLPSVLFRQGHPPVLLVGFTETGDAEIIDPTGSEHPATVPKAELAAMVKPEVLLVAPDARAAPSEGPRPDKHWFWGPMRQNWGGWIQIIFAALCLNLLGLALPLFVMNVYDRVIPNLSFVTLWTLALGVGLALCVELLMRSLRASVLEAITRRVDLKVGARLFEHALALRPNGQHGAAATASHIRDFEVVRDFFASATFVSVIDLMFIGIFVAVLFWLVGPIALVPLLAVPVVLALALAAQVPISRATGDVQRIATRRHVVLVEALSGLETVKSLNAEPVMQREWEDAVTAGARVNGKTRFWSGFATHGTMLVQQTVSVLIIVWGVFLVAAGEITVGGLIAANILAARVLAPLGTIAQTIFRAQYAFKSLSALNEFMALPPERPAQISGVAQVTEGQLSLRDVTVSYPGQVAPALDRVSLDVAAGEAVAILGRVGSGKTTLGRLVSGLAAIDSGVYTIDGFAVSQFDPAELRAGIGYLPQDPDLFTGTLRENLTIGHPAATEPEIQRVLALSGLRGFVDEAREGLETFVGERGGALSGGQRKGVALARLLLRRPRVLFLDEPTNGMDQQMEAALIEGLHTLNREGVGLLLSTHRHAVTALAQRIVVLDRGKVVLDDQRDRVLAKLGSDTQTAALGGT